MLSRIIFFSVILVILIGLEIYVFRGIRSTFRAGWPLRIALGIEVFSILVTITAIIGTFVFFSGGLTRSNLFTNLTMGAMVTFFMTKLVFACFLFGEDIFRVGKWSIDKIASLFQDDSPEVGMASRRKFIGQLGMAVAAIPFAGFLYGTLRGKYAYKVHRVKFAFPDLPAAFDGMRIVQLSDIHSGSFDNIEGVQTGVELVKKENPDLILFTGDLVNNLASEIEPYIELFGSLKARHGKFAVLGNHDYGEYYNWPSAHAKAENLEQLKRNHASMGFQMLNNANVALEKEGERIRLVGVENWGEPPFPQEGDLDKALEGVAADEFTILMSHDPTHWDAKVLPAAKQVHLTLSGHTHGAQMGVEIPGFRFSPVQWRYRRWAGTYSEKGQHLYINRGFGFIGYPGRIGIWPEITVIELARA